MKGLAAFMFFLLFLAGLALVNLRGMQEKRLEVVSSMGDIAESAWRPTHLGDMPLDENTSMFVQFNADGSVVGFAGCNQFFGQYEVEPETIKIGALGSTRKACPEPINSLEYSFLEALQASVAAIRADNQLELRDANSASLCRFVAAPLAAIAN